MALDNPRKLVVRFLAHLREPLFLNAYALILSSVATSALGIFYWGVAARTYPPEILGTNTALMSSMQLLSLLAQMGLVNVAIRFIPGAGRMTARLVVLGYLFALVMAFVTALVFILGIGQWTPSLRFVRDNPILAISFIVSTMGWVIFVIQDAVLVGLRHATLVPIENIIFAVVKIVLLTIFVRFIPEYGIFASWVIPSVAILVPTNILIFGFLIPRHVKKTAERAVPLHLRTIINFIAGNYLSTLVWNITISVLPLLVFQSVGAETSAYFYLPWTITFALHLVSSNMNMSFLAEVASDASKLASYSYRTWLNTIRLLVPAVLIIVIGAPVLLQLFGGNYATGGSGLMRLLALSTFGYSFTAHFLDISRARGRIKDAVIIQITLCFLIIMLGYLFLQEWGIVGIGIAWFIAQIAVGGVVFATKLRAMWLSEIHNSRLTRNINNVIRGIRSSRFLPLNAITLKRARRIISEVTVSSSSLEVSGWSKLTVIPTFSDMAVVAVGPEHSDAEGIIKITRSSHAKICYAKQITILAALSGDERLSSLKPLIPVISYQGITDNQFYSIERRIPGVSAIDSIIMQESWIQVCIAAIKAIRLLHDQTTKTMCVGDEILQHWIGDRLGIISRLYRQSRPGFLSQGAIAQISEYLHKSLLNQQFAVTWVHGDYWPGNLLVNPHNLDITGIIDWESAGPDELPETDVLFLFMTTRMLRTGMEFGEVAIDLLSNPFLTIDEKRIIKEADLDSMLDTPSLRTLALLTWLRHVSDALNRTSGRSTNWYWNYLNVEKVLRTICP